MPSSPRFFLLLLAVGVVVPASSASCGAFTTGTNQTNADGGGVITPPAGDGGRDGGGGGTVGCPASAPLGSFCDNFDRDGELTPTWDFASAKGISLVNDGPAASPPGALLIDVPIGVANRPTYAMKSFPNRKRLRFDASVNFVEDGGGTITLLSFVLDGPGGVLDYRIDFWHQFKNQPWKIEEFKQNVSSRNTELKDAASAAFVFGPGWTLVQAELDLVTNVFTLRIGSQNWMLEGLVPPPVFNRHLVSVGLPQAVDVQTPFKVRIDDVVITPSL
jgi:hypothetical protein